jgi:hypothetical protein
VESAPAEELFEGLGQVMRPPVQRHALQVRECWIAHLRHHLRRDLAVARLDTGRGRSQSDAETRSVCGGRSAAGVPDTISECTAAFQLQ